MPRWLDTLIVWTVIAAMAALTTLSAAGLILGWWRP